jgi:hypothetical protein
MPDFAPNVTFRYKLHYNAAGRKHTTQVRAARGTLATPGAGQCATYLRAVFDALKAIMPDDLSFLSAEYALTDSDLFFPAATPAAVVGGTAAASFSKQDSISHLTFSGRGSLGSKANLKLYCFAFNPDVLPAPLESDFVVLASEALLVSNAIAALNTGSGIIVAIDNSPINYYARATLKVNDFWLKRVRQGL